MGQERRICIFILGMKVITVTNLPRCQITQEENKCSYPARQRPTEDK